MQAETWKHESKCENASWNQLSPTGNDDCGRKFFFQKLVSDDLKWSEMPKKHDLQNLNFGEILSEMTPS